MEAGLGSRIVQIADVYDALRTNRPYQKARTPEQACAILRDGAGKVFDEQLLEVFLDRVVGDSRGPAPENPGEESGREEKS